jgi:hypothetical protein
MSSPTPGLRRCGLHSRGYRADPSTTGWSLESYGCVVELWLLGRCIHTLFEFEHHRTVFTNRGPIAAAARAG